MIRLTVSKRTGGGPLTPILLGIIPLIAGVLSAFAADSDFRIPLLFCTGLLALVIASGLRTIEAVLTLSFTASLYSKLIASLLNLYWLPATFDLVLLLCTVYLFLKRWKMLDKQAIIRFSFLCWLGFATVALVQVFNPNLPSTAVGAQGFRLTAFQSVAVVVGLLAFGRRTSTDRLWQYIAIAGVPVLLNALRQQFVWLPIDTIIMEQIRGIAPLSLGGGIARRSFSIFPSSFTLGMFGNFVFLLGLYFVYRRRGARWWFVVALGLVGAMTSLTRSTALAIAVSAGSFLVLMSGWRFLNRRTFVASCAMAAVVIGASLFIPAVVTYLNTFMAFWEDRHVIGRFLEWEKAWTAFREAPITAFGMGSAGDALEHLFVSGDSIHLVPHNVLLKLLVETGILGTSFFIALLAYPMVKTVTFLSSSKGIDCQSRTQMAFYVSVVVSFLIQGVSGSAIEAFPVNVWFWLCLGLLVRCLANATGRRPTKARLGDTI